MKILLIADVHANWPALSVIDETFDACLFVGDSVDYATEAGPCIDWLQQHMTVGVRGNHDHAVAQRITPPNGSGLRRLACATRPIHWETLERRQRKFLARLPVTSRVVLDGKVYYLVHATPRDPLDEYLNGDASTWASRLDAVDADFVCVGHTHTPYQLDLGRLQVINPGSVGQPRDGDSRAAYAVIDNGRVEFRRATYDIDKTLKHMREAGVPEPELDLAETFLRTGGRLSDDSAESSAMPQ
jgi:putative phosphoesterase